MNARIYDANMLTKIASLYQDISTAVKNFEGDDRLAPTKEDPLYIYGGEIVIRHQDGWTIGRIGWDDFLFFEFTDEEYVSAADEASKGATAAAVAAAQAAVLAHTRQEDTAAGQ